jgi:hypothetical protein
LARVDEVLAALNRGHGEGVPTTVDSLLALPSEVLPDQRAERGCSRRIQQRLKRIERGEPLDSDSDGDPPTPTPWRTRPRGTAQLLKATAIHRHLARDNISKAASRLDFEQIALPTPSDLQQLQDLHPAKDPPIARSRCSPA